MCLLALIAMAWAPAVHAKTVKVGVLHSLSGTMAISETSLKDVLLFTFDEINKSGGINVGGEKYMIEPVVVDPASNWPLFAEKAEQLLVKDRWPYSSQVAYSAQDETDAKDGTDTKNGADCCKTSVSILLI
jgi:urea transport system substrate-binding protein